MNNKFHKIKAIASAAMAICASVAVVSCAGSAGGNNSAGSQAKIAGQCNSNKAKNNMKLTKEMFYKDGKFDEAAAKKAYIEMMENLGYPISDNLRENMWVSDFALGNFPAVGMGGIFWAQENVHGVFGHEILLLPNQMLIEHYHVAGNGLPAKNECWQARAGTSYCFGENGEDASKYPDVKVPESQKKFITVNKVSVADAKKGNVVWMGRIGARHYQIAGPEGAVVTEYGTFHSNDNNRYTNPSVGF